MQAEIKKFKYHARMSQETQAFNGELWIDGEHVADLENRGNGEAQRVYPVAGHRMKVEQFEEYCKTLPSVESCGMTFKMDLDLWITDQVAERVYQIDLAKAMKKHLVIKRPEDGPHDFLQISGGCTAASIEWAKKNYPNCTILNPQ